MAVDDRPLPKVPRRRGGRAAGSSTWPPSTWEQIGDGSIWTTPTELVTWSSQYWDQTLDGPDLATVMFDPEVPADEGDEDVDDRYGSGILRATGDDAVEVLFHDGSWDGYETDRLVIPSEELAAALFDLWRP